jgi:hypothetical protein
VSLHDDMMAEAALPAHMAVQGIPATYHRVGEDDVSVTVIPRPVRGEERDDDSGLVGDRDREVTLLTDATSEFGGIADPAQNDSITIGGDVWTVQRIVSQSAGSAVLEVSRDTRREISRPGYRGRRG